MSLVRRPSWTWTRSTVAVSFEDSAPEMRVKRRRLPFERLQVIVSKERSASGATVTFGRLWLTVGFWTALVVLLFGLSFSFLHRHAEEIASFPQRTREYDSALLLQTTNISRANVAASSSFCTQPQVVSEFDAFALRSHLQTIAPGKDPSDRYMSDLEKSRVENLMKEFAQKYGGPGPNGTSAARGLLYRAFLVQSSSSSSTSLLSSSSKSSLDGVARNSTVQHHLLVRKVARHLPSLFQGTAAGSAMQRCETDSCTSIRILCLGGSAAAGWETTADKCIQWY